MNFLKGLEQLLLLIYKPSLPREGLGNYRPISGVSFIYKVIERRVAKQMYTHIVNNGLGNTCQSAYRAGHSTGDSTIKAKK